MGNVDPCNFGSLQRVTTYLCKPDEGKIVKSDKSPSQIRNPKFWIGRTLVQLQISDLGFKMQDSSDFQFPLQRRGIFSTAGCPEWPSRATYARQGCRRCTGLLSGF